MGNRGEFGYGSFEAKITPKRYLEVTSELKTAIICIGFRAFVVRCWRSSREREEFMSCWFQCPMMISSFFGKLMGRSDLLDRLAMQIYAQLIINHE